MSFQFFTFGRVSSKFGRVVESHSADVISRWEISSAVERLPYKQDVAGSIPAFPTNLIEITDKFRDEIRQSEWQILVETEAPTEDGAKLKAPVGKVLGLTLNNAKYQNVPDKLKWAIPIHECVSRPEVKRQSKLREALVDQKLAREERAAKSKKFTSLPKP